MNIKVKMCYDKLGGLVMRPVRKDIRDAIREYLKEWGYKDWDSIYVPNPEIDDYLTSEQRRDLNDGYTVVKLMDPYDFLSWVGWDAREGIVITKHKVEVTL